MAYDLLDERARTDGATDERLKRKLSVRYNNMNCQLAQTHEDGLKADLKVAFGRMALRNILSVLGGVFMAKQVRQWPGVVENPGLS